MTFRFQILNVFFPLVILHKKRSAAWHSSSPPFLTHNTHTLKRERERERSTRYKSKCQFIKRNMSHIRVDLKWGVGGRGGGTTTPPPPKQTNKQQQQQNPRTLERKIKQKENKTSYFSDMRAKHGNQIILLREK